MKPNHPLWSNAADEPDVLMDINTTPLIDVMLVLLIMLIITIPVQWHAVNLDMPGTVQTPPPGPPVILRVDVGADDAVSVNGQRMSGREQLAARLAEAAAQNPPPQVHIRSAPSARYGQAAMVLALAQKNGLQQLGILVGAP